MEISHVFQNSNLTLDKGGVNTIKIKTSIDEFKNNLPKLLEWKDYMLGKNESFSVDLTFFEMEEVSFNYAILLGGWYPKNYEQPPFLFNLSGKSAEYLRYANDLLKTRYNNIVKVLKECKLTNLLLKKLNTDKEDDKFDDIKFASGLNIFEKKYGDKLPIPQDIRFIIYRYSTSSYDPRYNGCVIK